MEAEIFRFLSHPGSTNIWIVALILVHGLISTLCPWMALNWPRNELILLRKCAERLNRRPGKRKSEKESGSERKNGKGRKKGNWNEAW